MNPYHLAVDLGASNGRLVLGRLENGRLQIEEVHRFPNRALRKNGHLCWDMEAIFREIITGMKRCHALGRIPASVGIDTWGVDFLLLDEAGHTIGDSVAYRDGRTAGMDAVLNEHMGEAEYYSRTGIQTQPFNTVYQLLALQRMQPEQLRRAKRFLMLPEYLSYLLCGVGRNEYTNATTTGLVHAETKTWDYELIARLSLPVELFGPMAQPGTFLGRLLPQIQKQVGYDCAVLLPCTHDTASAVVSAPIDDRSLYLSSGTWSLMGTELTEPICTEESRLCNLTHEGGYDYRFRYLKNIMGLWILQQARAERGAEHSFDRLCQLAREAADFPSRIDVNDNRFLAPESMAAEIEGACAQSGQAVPETLGELVCCIYRSLAESYGQTARDIEALTGRRYERVCIVGGGSKDEYLNRLTAAACGRTVTAGPAEGTAVGNLLVQMIAAGEISGLKEGRDIVTSTFVIHTYEGGDKHAKLL